jgi:hypothetical protein
VRVDGAVLDAKADEDGGCGVWVTGEVGKVGFLVCAASAYQQQSEARPGIQPDHEAAGLMD